MKTVLITGITGQDGCYLAKLLIGKGQKVIGLIRSSEKSSFKGLNYLGIFDEVLLEVCDLADSLAVDQIIKKYRPDEIYNLAAQSSVGESFSSPVETINFNILSTLNLLEAVKNLRDIEGINSKYYQASSSEMFGKVESLPVTENSVIHPLSPYAVSKAASHWATINYRESYGLFACCGILFNHESYLRRENFFVKKVLKESIEISRGLREKMFVGNLEVRRDFGYGPSYVEAMWLMLQQNKPEDYVICSGRSVELSEVVKYIFGKLNISIERCVVDDKLYRPVDMQDMYGEKSKAESFLGWKYEMDFFEVLDILLQEELANFQK